MGSREAARTRCVKERERGLGFVDAASRIFVDRSKRRPVIYICH